MKFKYFFLTLVYLAVGINAFSSDQEEEKRRPPQYLCQTHQERIPQEITPAEKLKNTIRRQVQELIGRLLENSEFQQTAFQKGWLNQEEEERGQLIQLLKKIDPSKKRVIQNIDRYFLSKGREIDRDTSDLPRKLIYDLDQLPDIMIESKIREYFQANIGKVLNIDDNPNGVQLKRIVTIQPPFSELPSKWYVKTHAGGLLKNTKNSTSKPIDPIELLTYKILEHSGYGTEAHFFYDDARNFYIGTKDVASYSDTQSVGSYPTFLKKDKSQFTQKIIDQYPAEKENPIIQGLMTSDILSRMLCLSDILTQDGNIVFVNNQGNWQLKIIDFRNSVSGYDYPDGSRLFGGLVQGNGQFNYIGVDRVMSHYLGNPNLKLRIDYARHFNYQNLRAAVGKAEGEMHNYMNLEENFKLFQNTQAKVYEHSAAIKNIISQFEIAAHSHSF
jgi:hypothetical protein